MKNFLLITLSLFFSFSAMAQSDKKARAILDEVSAKTKTYKTIRIEFAYNMVNTAQKINDTYKGVLISKGDKYKLSFSGQDVISDGKTAWTFLNDANEVQSKSDGENASPFPLLSIGASVITSLPEAI